MSDDQTSPPNYEAMSAGEMLAAVGMDGAKWTDAFLQTFPKGCADWATMYGWFCNAIMAGYDRRGLPK